MASSKNRWQYFFLGHLDVQPPRKNKKTCLENKLLSISINFTPKTSNPVAKKKWYTTVDGKNPAPVEVGSFFHYLHGFIHPKWIAGYVFQVTPKHRPGTAKRSRWKFQVQNFTQKNILV